jgi:TRAP-type mannitol/chloroaromatic compound transport system permease large subunit
MLIVIVCVVFMVFWPGMTRWLPPKSKVFRTPTRGA